MSSLCEQLNQTPYIDGFKFKHHQIDFPSSDISDYCYTFLFEYVFSTENSDGEFANKDDIVTSVITPIYIYPRLNKDIYNALNTLSKCTSNNPPKHKITYNEYLEIPNPIIISHNEYRYVLHSITFENILRDALDKIT